MDAPPRRRGPKGEASGSGFGARRGWETPNFDCLAKIKKRTVAEVGDPSKPYLKKKNTMVVTKIQDWLCHYPGIKAGIGLPVLGHFRFDVPMDLLRSICLLCRLSPRSPLPIRPNTLGLKSRKTCLPGHLPPAKDQPRLPPKPGKKWRRVDRGFSNAHQYSVVVQTKNKGQRWHRVTPSMTGFGALTWVATTLAFKLPA